MKCTGKLDPCLAKKRIHFIENTRNMKLKHWKSLDPLLQWNVYSQQENALRERLEVIRMAKPPFPSSWALPLLFQSRARLCAGIAQSKKTQKKHLRSTLLTHVIFFGYIVRPVWKVCIPFILTIIAIGIVSLLFPFAYIRYENFSAANCIINSHRENNESASHPVGFLECWESETWSAPLLSKWMSFSRFWTKFTLGTPPHFLTLQNCTERLNGVALRTYRRTKPPLL